MKLDISNLSPMCLDEILRFTREKCSHNAWVILNDLPSYSEGEVKNEMEGWRKAAQDIVNQIHEYQYPLQKRNKTID